MLQSISNGVLDVAIETRGAELQSLRRRGGQTEYLWQGDPSFWGRRAPVLFPIVGRLRGDRYRVGGQEYALPQHGFARDAGFTVLERHPDHVAFLLKNSPATREVYPFPFELGIRYKLEDTALDVRYEVLNPGTDTLWFSIGAHPGFNCPLRRDEAFEDYEVVFESEETADRMFLEGGLIAPGKARVLAGARRLPLTRELFAPGALVFEGLRSSWAGLGRRCEGLDVVVRFAGWTYLGIWTAPGAPFVCIEPWSGIADDVDFDGDLSEKTGIVALEPGGRKILTYSIEVAGR